MSTTSKLTIIEALQELKTIDKRIEKKHEAVLAYLFHQEGVKDPHEKAGGSAKFIKEALQSIDDLVLRRMRIRNAINVANQQHTITIDGDTYSVAEWLIYKRELHEGWKARLRAMLQAIRQQRDVARKNGLSVLEPGQDSDNPKNYILNADEPALYAAFEAGEVAFSQLDGKLSLANATIVIEV